MDTLLNLSHMLVGAALAALFAAGTWRLLRGPSPLDRILGFDAAALALVGYMTSESIRLRRSDFFELILLFTLFGFLGTTWLVLYLWHHPRPTPTEDAP